MKGTLKIFAAMLTVMMIIVSFPFIAVSAYDKEAVSVDTHKTYEKEYSEAAINDNFSDNELIIIVFSQYNKKEYSTSDFTEIKCVSVEELMKARDRDDPSRMLLLTIEGHSKEKVLESIKLLEVRDDMYYVGPNYYYDVIYDDVIGDGTENITEDNALDTDSGASASATDANAAANDPSFKKQWGLEKINISSAWNLSTGSSAIRVGIIDSGIANTHPDLKNRVAKKDANGNDISRSFLTNASNPYEDVYGHGTLVAGIIGAEADNNLGIAGVCKNVSLVSLRWFYKKDSGHNSSADLAEIIEYAGDNNIRILNFSYHSPGNDDAKKTAAMNFNGLIVCSAGNYSVDIDVDTEYDSYPQEYGLPNVIVVGASTDSDNLRSSSNWGKKTVDLFAPGEGIFTTTADGGYRKANGTSMAAPFVAGVAALMLSKEPTLTGEELKTIIINSVDKVDAMSDKCVSGGRLNAWEAVKNAHHFFKKWNISSGGHDRTCMVCGYKESGKHDWIINLKEEYPFTCRICGYKTKNAEVGLCIKPVATKLLANMEEESVKTKKR